jgi:hypothetical protein
MDKVAPRRALAAKYEQADHQEVQKQDGGLANRHRDLLLDPENLMQQRRKPKADGCTGNRRHPKANQLPDCMTIDRQSPHRVCPAPTSSQI